MIFKNIGVIPNETKDPLLVHTKSLIDYFAGRDINIFLCGVYKQKINNCVLEYMGKLIYADEDELYKSCDLLVALGGDGTVLRLAAKASRLGKPVIGVNLGRIGFMNEIEPHEIELFERVLAGDYKVESRMMLDVEIIKSAGITRAGPALNDAVITNGVIAKLIELDLFCDGAKITRYRADGVIIATPTGSTAYAMSAGGPIIDPNIACLCVTPICPQSLVSRPMIFSHDSVLEVRSGGAYLAVDGQLNIELGEGDTVRVSKSRHTADLISVKNRGFFDVIREKFSEN